MNSELDTAWTMVMSWCTTNRKLPAFVKYPFNYNSPQNEDALNWDLYRLSLARMRYLQKMSTHWRATCSYPLKGIDFRDYLRGNFQDFNIFSFVGTGVCKKVEYVNIRGHVGTDVRARFFQKLNEYTLHIDTPSGSNNCQFNPKAGAVSSEDNFGWYGNSASALNSDARQQTNPSPSIDLVLSANLLRDKTALQWVTELDHGPSHLIFKKH